MKVVTVTYSDLGKFCHNLVEDFSKNAYTPDLILGIRTGGAEIGRVLSDCVKDKVVYLECSSIRPRSTKKKNILKCFIKFLPRPILDRLRILEAKSTFSYNSRKKIERVVLPDGIKRFDNILIVDDAVDSGATLQAVYDAVHEVAPGSTVKSAAITVTTHSPAIMPDFYIFHNSTLIRFPWSMDAKTK